MPETPEPTARRRRRLLPRPTLGAGMILVLAVGLGLGWVANAARRQARAVELIRAAGGEVVYRHQAGRPAIETPGPRWLRRLVGDDSLRAVVAVRLDARMTPRPRSAPTPPRDLLVAIGDLDSVESVDLRWLPIEDRDLAPLAGPGRLRSLRVSGSGLTDAGLAEVGRMRGLEFLAIESGAFTDSGVAHLAALGGLKALTLSPVRALGDGLSRLSSMGALQSLDLSIVDARGLGALDPPASLQFLSPTTPTLGPGDLDDVLARPGRSPGVRLCLRNPRPTDGEIGRIAASRRLVSLELDWPGLTDAQVARIGGLDGLAELSISDGSALTDEALRALRGLRSLRTLDIPGRLPAIPLSRITDRGLDAAASMPALRRLRIMSNALTAAGVAAARARHPGLAITAPPGTPDPPAAPRVRPA